MGWEEVFDQRMKAFVVMTVLGPDRTGLVQALSEIIAERGGNWLESRMARMAGQFAGILRVECEAEDADQLIEALNGLDEMGLAIQARREETDGDAGRRSIQIDVVGNDRPGIVRALSAAIAGAGGNVEDLHTSLESAPMSGHPIFHARGVISLGEGGSAGSLMGAIENLGEDLAVTVEE